MRSNYRDIDNEARRNTIIASSKEFVVTNSLTCTNKSINYKIVNLFLEN